MDVDPRAKVFTNRLPVASTAQPSGVAMAGSVAQVVMTLMLRPVKATRVTVAGMEGVLAVQMRYACAPTASTHMPAGRLLPSETAGKLGAVPGMSCAYVSSVVAVPLEEMDTKLPPAPEYVLPWTGELYTSRPGPGEGM